MSRRGARERAIDAATELIAERGYAGTSVQAVADAVGIRKASLLHHFPSKEELRTAVLDAIVDRWREELPALLAEVPEGHRRFEALVGRLVSYFRESPHRARLVVREGLDRPEDMRELLREHVSPWLTLIAPSIREGQASGRLHPGVDPEAYVLNVIFMAIWAVAMEPVAPSALPPPRDADRAIAEMERIAHDSLFLPRPTT